MTPIFMRNWLMKITAVLDLMIAPESLRSAWRHQAGLETDMRIAHIAFDLGAGHQRGDRVDHDDVDGVRAHQRLADLERLLAGIGLRDEQIIDIDAAAAA